MRPCDTLQEQIDIWWGEFLAAMPAGYCPESRQQELSGEIDDFDAAAFLQGMSKGLFWVESGYRMYTEMRPRLVSGGLTQFHLFERVGPRCQLRQENISHYAAASELVLDYEWPMEQVAIESPATPSLTAGALDLVVFSDATRSSAVIGGEAKAKRDQLHRMMSGLRRCGGDISSGAHSVQEHKKCLGILTFRPRLFLGVAGGTREVFRLTHDPSGFQISEKALDLEVLRAPQAR